MSGLHTSIRAGLRTFIQFGAITAIAFSLTSAPFGMRAAMGAQDPAVLQKKAEEKRKQAEELKKKAEDLKSDVASLRQSLIDLARNAQEREALVSSLEGQLVELRAEAQRRQARLKKDEKRLSGTIGALARLSGTPPEAIVFHPGNPVDAVRGAILLKAAVPALRDRADLLKEEIQALTNVRSDISGKLAEIADTNKALAEERKRINGLLARKTELLEKTSGEAEKADARAAELAGKAKSLQELLARLKEDSRIRPPEKPRPEDKGDAATTDAGTENTALALARPDGVTPFPSGGTVLAPVRGRIMVRYGQDTGFGHTSKGVIVATRPHAQVVAPHDGKVVFAGPFRNYGSVLILQHQGDFHTVLAGLDRVDAVVGQWVLSGEPVGLTADHGDGNSPDPTLYVELRRKGEPVNPLNWISAGSIGVHG